MQADTYRIATFAAPLSRDGPGLLLRDLQRGDDPQIAAITDVITHLDPDVLILTDFDYDQDLIALRAFADRFNPGYPHLFALRPNAGLATGLDLDGNGRLGDARDAQGYGRFAGDGGMAIMSRFAVLDDQVTDISMTLWRDLPGATLPQMDGVSFLDPAAQDVLRLSSTAHWIVPIALPDGAPLSVMAFSATPPVFDGPEDMNGLRNRDELRLWEVVLSGAYGPAPDSFVVAGNANLDPQDGDGFSDAMTAFLQNPLLQDALPGQATADWPEDGPGDLRVSYVLPSADWTVSGAGVFWPAPDDPDRALIGDDGLAAGPHRIVWVDITRW
ncbi:endonuclease/exonuclease/phosphatase family protein [Roseobacter sp. CCS2]|uniref:endonuclease/exonuclease/phosphatase family protein n=1 Tax=Roseobacter sp. CCS2 TaxID=391593 RepID=UPI000312B439